MDISWFIVNRVSRFIVNRVRGKNVCRRIQCRFLVVSGDTDSHLMGVHWLSSLCYITIRVADKSLAFWTSLTAKTVNALHTRNVIQSFYLKLLLNKSFFVHLWTSINMKMGHNDSNHLQMFTECPNFLGLDLKLIDVIYWQKSKGSNHLQVALCLCMCDVKYCK